MRLTSLLVPAFALSVGGCAVSATAGRAPVGDGVRASILALVTDGLERLRLGDPRGITSRCAEDVTYYSVEFDSLRNRVMTLEALLHEAAKSRDEAAILRSKVAELDGRLGSALKAAAETREKV